jgi:hypothetical protein
MAIGNTTRDFGNLPMSCVLPIGDQTPQPLQGGKEYTDSQGNVSAPAMVALGDTWKNSYSVGFTLVVAAGDAVTIAGSATKTIKITRIKYSGTSTAATGAAVDVALIKRSTADTAGTSTAPTPVPLDSNDAAVTAVVTAYTVAPTLGTAVGTIAVDKYVPTLATATATDFPIPAYVEYMFGNRPSHGIVLRGTAQQLCINFSATPLATNSFDFTIEWTEE